MGLNTFTSMVGYLNGVTSINKEKIVVPKKDYELFCKEFVFDRLKEVSFAEAFCKRFEVDDNVLLRLSDDSARFIIETVGYIEE